MKPPRSKAMKPETEDELRAEIIAHSVALKLRDTLDIERAKSDAYYAKIIVERIMFAFLGVIVLSVIGAMLTLVLRQ